LRGEGKREKKAKKSCAEHQMNGNPRRSHECGAKAGNAAR
jgi:hypothetical protein